MTEPLLSKDAVFAARALEEAIDRLTADGSMSPSALQDLATVQEAMHGAETELSLIQRQLAVEVLGRISQAMCMMGEQAHAESIERAANAVTSGPLLIVGGTA